MIYCIGVLLPAISEIPDIRFTQRQIKVREDDGAIEVCVVAGQLVAELTPVNVTISTAVATAIDAATGIYS